VLQIIAHMSLPKPTHSRSVFWQFLQQLTIWRQSRLFVDWVAILVSHACKNVFLGAASDSALLLVAD
jgi:hypothetical protein